MIKTLDISEFTPQADLTIWDVRDTDNYKKGHITHAINVPLDDINHNALNTTTGDIYVLCGGGTKALKACERLEKLNPNRTYIHLTGGTRGAIALGWDIVSEEKA